MEKSSRFSKKNVKQNRECRIFKVLLIRQNAGEKSGQIKTTT